VEKVGSALGVDKHQVKVDTVRFKEFIEHRGIASGAYHGDQPAPGARDSQDAHADIASDLAAADQRDIVDVLLAQHAEIKLAFARLQEAAGGDREHLFAQLAGMLHRHETGEQQVVHPAIRNDSADGEGVAVARMTEEHLADEAIAELERLGVDHDDFDRQLEALHQAVLSHAAHEEGEEFPLLRKLSVEQRMRLADDVRSAQAAER
jgi:iron-sulfur cluster repair protein YtfE (RIC family)